MGNEDSSVRPMKLASLSFNALSIAE